MTSIKLKVESSEMSAVEVQKKLAKDAKHNHISAKQMMLYVNNKSSLTDSEIKEIEAHRKDCDKCDYNISRGEENTLK